jgi:hypothetical protein
MAAAGQSFAVVEETWSVTLGEQQLTTPLKTWEELGVESFNGTAVYKDEFTIASALPEGQHAYLDLGNVHEDARPLLNGNRLEARAWPPYVWDVTKLIKTGANSLEVQVQAALPPPQRGGGGAGARPNGAGGPGPQASVPGAPTAGARRGGSASQARNSGLLGPVRVLAQ